MAKEYIVKLWQPWETEEGLARDNHGNYKGSVTFEGEAKAVDATFKEQPNPGDKKYGSIEDYQTRSGKTRQKFSRAERPPEATAAGASAQGSFNRDNDAIRAQWAISQAKDVELERAKFNADILDKTVKLDVSDEIVLDRAIRYFHMVEVVKSSTPPITEVPDREITIEDIPDDF